MGEKCKGEGYVHSTETVGGVINGLVMAIRPECEIKAYKYKSALL